MTADLLLVDSAPDRRAALVPSLRERGFAVREAASAGAAGSALASHPAQVLVVAAPLPDCDATEWLASLRVSGVQVPLLAYLSDADVDVEMFRVLRLQLGVALVARQPVAPVPFADEVALLWQQQQPDEGPGDSFDRHMDTLRRAFAAELPARASALVTAFTRLSTAGDVAAVRTAAHGLRGTAGTYGFADVAAAASRLEDALDAMQVHALPGPVTESPFMPRARVAVQELEVAAKAAAQAAG